nr:transposase [uncultured Prevotella sp.]
MFKKSSNTKQFDMFNSPSGLLCKREGRLYDDPNAWHNTFYREVTSNIDEEIFKPLYTTVHETNRVGRPNVPIRILVAMMILKEGVGCSDEQLYEQCRFNLLYRRALGMVNLDEQCPTIDSYYGLRRRICKHEEETGVNLFDKCFKQITRSQAKEYRISGKAIRMDSKLISSNIAWYSRYEIIHESFVKSVTKEELGRIADQLVRQQALDFFVEDARKTVYRTDSETMGRRLLDLGIVIDYILTHSAAKSKPILERVFSEQYEKTDDGVVFVRDKRKISAKSVQNPNDPDAEYRGKHKQKVKGFSTNITETLPEPNKPSLITDVKVKGATAADNDFFEDAVKATEEVTGDDVETAYVDGAYQSQSNRDFAKDEDISIVAGGLQGKPSRFDLNMVDTNTLEVTDKSTGEVQTALPVKSGKWKIVNVNADGKKTCRYFSKEQVDKAEVRRQTDSIPFEERKKRNNVEAAMFQYGFHTRNNKTRYRSLIKHSLQAIARCAWMNMRRIFWFEYKLSLQIAK